MIQKSGKRNGNEIYPIFSLYKNVMKIKYFTDTDTALVEFSDHQVAQTKEINENIYVDLDTDDNLVNMTIEHASKQANIAEVAYQQIERQSP
jgi:uncharacterized protein YuzE